MPLEVMRTLFKKDVSDASKELQEFTELQMGELEGAMHALIHYCHFTQVEGNSHHSGRKNCLVKQMLIFLCLSIFRFPSNVVSLDVEQDLVNRYLRAADNFFVAKLALDALMTIQDLSIEAPKRRQVCLKKVVHRDCPQVVVSERLPLRLDFLAMKDGQDMFIEEAMQSSGIGG